MPFIAQLLPDTVLKTMKGSGEEKTRESRKFKLFTHSADIYEHPLFVGSSASHWENNMVDRLGQCLPVAHIHQDEHSRTGIEINLVTC